MKVKLGNEWPYCVSKKDLEIKYCRGSGAGGQHRNKTSNACQITHIPTGIQVRSEEERMASQNLKTAFNKLAKKLIPLMKKAAQSHNTEKVENSNRIRTYNEKDQRVIDTRINNKIFQYDDILYKDGLDKLIVELSKKNN